MSIMKLLYIMTLMHASNEYQLQIF